MKKQYAAGNRPFDALDALIGVWSEKEAAEFAAAIAPFGAVEPHLWRVKPLIKRRNAKTTRR